MGVAVVSFVAATADDDDLLAVRVLFLYPLRVILLSSSNWGMWISDSSLESSKLPSSFAVPPTVTVTVSLSELSPIFSEEEEAFGNVKCCIGCIPKFVFRSFL